MAPAKVKKPGRSTAKGKKKRKGREGEGCATSITDRSIHEPKRAEGLSDLRRHVQQAYREALIKEGEFRP